MTSRVHWKPDEQRSLAQRVAKGLLRLGVNPLDDDESAVRQEMMSLLQSAINTFARERRRVITTPNQVPWIIPMMREMVLASRGESHRFPADILTDKHFEPPRGVELPYYAPENLATENDVEYSIPPDYSLVEDTHWDFLHKQIRRNSSRIRTLTAKVDHLADQIASLVDLFLEQAGSPPAEFTPVVPDGAPVSGPGIPLVVVAGLRENDRKYVSERVGELAEIEFFDPTRAGPDRVGDCDWLIATRFCGRGWLAGARRRFANRFSEVHSNSGVVHEIERLRQRRD